MIDTFPFLRVTGRNEKEMIEEIINYLTQFKETLEFELTSISSDNLSSELISKLNSLGADIKQSNTVREDEMAQVQSKALTVSDVCNSDLFKQSVESETSKYISFNVNFETGHLEYALANEGKVNNGL